MNVRAIHKNARMSPRKIRPVARLVRGMSVERAEQQLQFLPGKAAKILQDVLRSAVANAMNNHDLKKDSLKVSDVQVGDGLVMKRFQPVSRGMAHPILKRTAHVTVVVSSDAPVSKKKKAKTEIEEITADEYTTRQVKEDHDHDHDHGEEVATKKGSSAAEEGEHDRTVESRSDKQNYTAFQKTKMEQQGGDKKKTHRRKSIGS